MRGSPERSVPVEMTEVHYALSPDYSPANLRRALPRVLDPVFSARGGVSGKRVMIKPNLLEYRHPEDPAAVDPRMLVELCRYLRDSGASSVSVVEIPAVRTAEAVIASMGIADELRDLGVSVSAAGSFDKAEMPSRCRYHRLELSTEYRNCDLMIDFAKAKTHAMMTLTLGVKNLFGLIRGSERLSWHLAAGREFEDFAEMLLDLWLLVRPQVTLLDAVVGMEGNGPGSGDPVRLGFLCASADALALDRSVAQKLGVTETPLFRRAAARGLPMAYADCGEVPEPRRVKLPDPPEKTLEWGVYFPVRLRRFLRGMMLTRPVLDRSKCISCGLCVSKCPPQSLKMHGKAPRFDYAGCIRCYCCQEFCPRGAISVRPGRLTNFVRLLEKVIRRLNIRVSK